MAPHVQRLSVAEVDPAAYEPMLALEKYVHGSTLGEELSPGTWCTTGLT